ncbi:MAG TPA: SprT family zinc-dependent metalloprotease [Thermomicrobiales bacterium]|nr:SprT family zinc-dependent metalloprotease [Thermomicrobiales bacterium]
MTVRPFRRISGAQVKSELVFGEEVLDVTRKAIRNVYIRIDPVSGVIRVSAPHSASDTHISAIVERHSSWIRRKRTSLSKSIQLPKRSLDDGCELTILGKNYLITIEYLTRRTMITERDGLILIRASVDGSRDQIQRAFDRWLDELLLGQIRALVHTYEPVMGVRAGPIVVRQMRSRWGSCKPQTGRICLNRELAWLPPQYLEYVVVHEMCHLLERGHNASFYQYMTRFFPDWPAVRQELRAIGIRSR